jgi:putative membrane-bound dehydrogenase-like protein
MKLEIVRRRAVLRGILSLLVLTLSSLNVAAGSSAPEALKQMKVAEGFEVELVASEPDIRQPISITFDHRGRMWVIQYLQYPTPAGLKAVSVDPFLRTTYDRLPEPPPRGPKGADRITICELNINGAGTLNFKDFVSGLNLCSGMALGHCGVFVMQPPYLLFYADKNRDDVPDGDPEVLLTGFGMEDAHAFANSLTWGPDGWLYGAQGSTVTARVRGLEFQQGIWRYHPMTREFELFSEGGGNTWGLDFDERGEIIAGTNFDDKMLHQVQGAYYVKNFGKHGGLHNPYAYGYFGHVPYTGYRGAHISIGGIVYQGGAFPAPFDAAYIFGNTLDHAVYWATLKPQGSSFTAEFAGALLKTGDELFRPVDCEAGPDGAVYIADWCDKRASHLDPLDTWDRSNGRIYRVKPAGATPVFPRGIQPGFDLEKLSSDILVSLLSVPNDWFVRQARLLLAQRHDPSVLTRLRKQVADNSKPRLALESLWALYVGGGFDDPLAIALLQHPNENVRAWTIRLLGDARKVSPPIRQHLAEAARMDPSPIVRAQLACTAKRLPGPEALDVITGLLPRDEDSSDQHIPLLIWWALEDKAIAERSRVLKLFESSSVWNAKLAREHIIPRLARRYAEHGGQPGFAACAQLLQLAPRDDLAQRVMLGMEEAMAGRRFENAPPELLRWFSEAWRKHRDDLAYVRFGVRLGNAEATTDALEKLSDETAAEPSRASLIEALGQSTQPAAATPLLAVFERSKSERLRMATLDALQHFPGPEVARGILEVYPRLDTKLRNRARLALCARPAWAQLLLGAIDAGRIEPKEVTLDELRQMASLKDPELQPRIEKRWGKIDAGSPEEKRNSVNRLKLVLKPSGVVGRDAHGNLAEGKKVFQAACGICHKLFGEGNSIGPDLSGADRKNTDYLLEQIVNPTAYIRPEYASFEAELRDERVITGLVIDSNASSVTLVDRNNERHVVARDQLKELKASAVSLMPEGLLEALSPEQVMNLFAYLQSDPAAR